MRSPCKKVASLVRGRGVSGACAHVLEVIKNDLNDWLEKRRSLAEEAEFDRRRGVHTSARIDPKTLSVIGSHRASAVRYQPISEGSFRTLLARLIDLLGDALPLYRFIDMGCGMGKVLLLAAEYPFQQVIGVEFAPELVAICEKESPGRPGGPSARGAKGAFYGCGDHASYATESGTDHQTKRRTLRKGSMIDSKRNPRGPRHAE